MRRVCILSFAPLATDARVLRQVEYLSRSYSITVAALPPMPGPVEGVEYRPVQDSKSRLASVFSLATLLLGRLAPPAYTAWVRLRKSRRITMRMLSTGRFDLVLVDEWPALFVAMEALSPSVPIVFDSHEYSPAEFAGFRFRHLHAPLVRHILRRAARRRIPGVTVSEEIAERYEAEFGLQMHVVLNASAPVSIPDSTAAPPHRIRLIHHGSARRGRRLEVMIDAISLADERFALTFMLVGDQHYIADLRGRAEGCAPGRISFRPPVPPGEIVSRLTDYDLGLHVLESQSLNDAMALPNKFFDFVAAGLGVVIGPSPAMERLGSRYGFTRVAADFTPDAVADTLNTLGPDDVTDLRAAARRARDELNADIEMEKLAALVSRFTDDHR